MIKLKYSPINNVYEIDGKGYFRTSFSVRYRGTNCKCSCLQYCQERDNSQTASCGYEVLDGYGKVWLKTDEHKEAMDFKNMINSICLTARNLEAFCIAASNTIATLPTTDSKEAKIGRAILEIIKTSKEI